MRIELHSSRIEVSNTIREYVERRLGFALGRFSDVVQQVVVALEDINGPRGGVDQLCRIRVQLSGQKAPVIAEVADVEIRASVDVAADRIGRAVSRQLDRRTSRRFVDKRQEALQPTL